MRVFWGKQHPGIGICFSSDKWVFSPLMQWKASVVGRRRKALFLWSGYQIENCIFSGAFLTGMLPRQRCAATPSTSGCWRWAAGFAGVWDLSCTCCPDGGGWGWGGGGWCNKPVVALVTQLTPGLCLLHSLGGVMQPAKKGWAGGELAFNLCPEVHGIEGGFGICSVMLFWWEAPRKNKAVQK